MEELKKACEAAIKYLEESHNPHTKIIISIDAIEVVGTEIYLPIKKLETNRKINLQ